MPWLTSFRLAACTLSRLHGTAACTPRLSMVRNREPSSYTGHMHLDTNQRKDLRRLAHHLKPIVTVAERGLTESVMAEIERALIDHELIKVRITSNDRTLRSASTTEICATRDAALVAEIGKIAVLYRHNPNAKPHLSNLQRPAPAAKTETTRAATNQTTASALATTRLSRSASAKTTKTKSSPAKLRSPKNPKARKPPRILRPR